jgi:hypothetical protein
MDNTEESCKMIWKISNKPKFNGENDMANMVNTQVE